MSKAKRAHHRSCLTLMVRSAQRVSNHAAPLVPFILRDAAARLLRMRSHTWQVGTLRFAHPTRFEHYLFLFTGLRFSMNAAMPSERSSSAKVEWNKLRSTFMPSDNGVSNARLMASLAMAAAGRDIEAIPWEQRKPYDEFDYGYVLTVHKSQGSQWDDVVLFDESFAFQDSRARWLYTGITRAAKRLSVVV